MRNDGVTTLASVEDTMNTGEHDVNDVKEEDPTQEDQHGQVRISCHTGGIFSNLN